MPYTIYVNGNGFPYPETGDTAWGNNATNFAKSVGTALGLIGLGQVVNYNGSIIKIDSSTQGIYIPRVATGSLPAGTKDKSLLLYNSTSDRFEYWNGTAWAPLGENASGDLTVTRNLTVDTDVLKTDATNNRVGINTSSPTEALDVTGKIKASDQILTTNGSVTAPFIAPSGDPNTGLYVISADQIGIAANGARVGEFGVGYGGFTGNVIQVQFGSYNTNIVINSTSTFADSNVSVSITPKYTSSKILILGSIAGIVNSTDFVKLRLMRDSTQIQIMADAAYNGNASGQAPINYLDSPNTTSSITYKVQFARLNAGTAVINNYGATIPMSTITALEIQQ